MSSKVSCINWVFKTELLFQTFFRFTLESIILQRYNVNYKDRKYAGNQNSSVRIKISMGKTSNNRPLRNGSSFEFFHTQKLHRRWKMHAVHSDGSQSEQYPRWRHACLGQLAKIKVDFFETKMPVLIIVVINTSCSAFVAAFTPAKNSFNNALVPDDTQALFWIFGGCKSCNKYPRNQYLFLHSLPPPLRMHK